MARVYRLFAAFSANERPPGMTSPIRLRHQAKSCLPDRRPVNYSLLRRDVFRAGMRSPCVHNGKQEENLKRYVRFEANGKIQYGTVEGDTVLAMSEGVLPWEKGFFAAEKLPLKAVRLLCPAGRDRPRLPSSTKRRSPRPRTSRCRNHQG